MRGRGEVYGRREADEEEPLSGVKAWRIEELPPLPKATRDKLLQSLGGVTYVLVQIGLAVGGTHGFVLHALPQLLHWPVLSAKLWWSFCIAIYSQVTLLCL